MLISSQHHPRCLGRDNGCIESSCCIPYLRPLLASWIHHWVCAFIAFAVIGSETIVLTLCFRRPLIGGMFSHPAKHFALFERIPFFTVYPYALPCFISGVIALGGAALGYFYLEEVHLLLTLFFDIHCILTGPCLSRHWWISIETLLAVVHHLIASIQPKHTGQ